MSRRGKIERDHEPDAPLEDIADSAAEADDGADRESAAEDGGPVEAGDEPAADGEEGAGENDGAAVDDVGPMGGERLQSLIESLVFAAGAPLPLRRLNQVLNGPPLREVRAALAALAERYDSEPHGIRLVEVAGGFQFRTVPENAHWVRLLLRERPARLGRATLETLAVISYRQPVTRAEIEAVRGVDCDSAVSSLLGKRLIQVAGRKEAVGRPLMYATTPEFLELFGLKDLKELPALKEIGPAAEDDDDDTIEADDESGGAPAEDPEPRGGDVAAAGGGDDPDGTGEGERQDGDRGGGEGGRDQGPDHG